MSRHLLPRKKLQCRLKWAAAMLFALPLVVGIYLGILQVRGNFHEALPNELYRSAQLEPGDIARYKQLHGIRTVLNLRGDNTGQLWYDQEISEANAEGVGHINFRMKAARALTKEEAIQLITLMRDAPKPLLVHCRAGADRTGLASALYMAAIAKKGEWAAEKQLWINYGHLPFSFAKGYAMNETFEALEPYLGFPNS